MLHDVRRRVFLLVVLGFSLVVLVGGASNNAYPLKESLPPSSSNKMEQSLAAQEEPAEEKELSFEEQHTDQSAIGLVNDYSIELKDDWSFVTKSYFKIKILKEDARDTFGEIPVNYREGIDEITELDIYTITPDGKKHPYSKVQDFKQYPEYAEYSDLRVRVFTMQEVNVGSIIVINKTIRSKGKTIPMSYWAEDFFSYSKPTVESNIVYRFPKSLNIRYKEFNLAEDRKPLITEDDQAVTYTWHIKNSYRKPSNEDLIPPPRIEDVKDAIEFSSFTSWDDINRWFYQACEDSTVMNAQIKEAAKNIFKDKQSLEDKVRACLEYIQDNFRYVSMSFGEHSFKPHRTDEIFANKYGDCKDLSLLCKTLLSLAGIESRLALFRDEGSISDPKDDLPIPNEFDHVIVLVKNPQGKDFYVDPQLKNYNLGEYPLWYQLAYTFVIDKDKGTFDRLPEFSQAMNSRRKTQEIYMNPDDMDTYVINVTWNLDESIQWKQIFQAATDQEKEEFEQGLFAQLAPEGEILEHRIEGLEDRYGTLKAVTKFKDRSQFLVVNDMIIVEFYGNDRSSSFTEKERRYPIFYPGASEDENMVTYHLPKGFFVEYLPPNLEFDNGFWKWERIFKTEGDKVILTEREVYRRAEIPVDQYPRIKKFYDEMPRKTHQIMLFKKEKPLWEELKDISRRWRR